MSLEEEITEQLFQKVLELTSIQNRHSLAERMVKALEAFPTVENVAIYDVVSGGKKTSENVFKLHCVAKNEKGVYIHPGNELMERAFNRCSRLTVVNRACNSRRLIHPLSQGAIVPVSPSNNEIIIWENKKIHNSLLEPGEARA